MEAVLRLRTRIQPGGKIEVTDAQLPAGNLVDLLVLFPQPLHSSGVPLWTFLGKRRGILRFRTRRRLTLIFGRSATHGNADFAVCRFCLRRGEYCNLWRRKIEPYKTFLDPFWLAAQAGRISLITNLLLKMALKIPANFRGAIFGLFEIYFGFALDS